ncbi:MAG: hypothetical protein IJX99_08465 [Clostridia bacterium]|nr:hypothetical protein [Clostridia bacterium]
MDQFYDQYNAISQKELGYLCDSSSDQIFDALEKISLITNLYSVCQIKIPPPFATNFRDSLFHYKKLYESDTVEEALQQTEAIDEHLSRAIKDSLMQLVQILLNSISKIYEDPSVSDTLKLDIQKQIHNLKQAILRLRINSMDIVRISEDSVEIMDEIAKCIKWCSKNETIKLQLLDLCSKYVKRIDVHFEHE